MEGLGAISGAADLTMNSTVTGAAGPRPVKLSCRGLWKVFGPEAAGFLRAHWSVPRDVALRIAVGSGGCVRAAMADLETWLDVDGGGLL